MKTIVLYGMREAGKTALGKKVSEKLNKNFCDSKIDNTGKIDDSVNELLSNIDKGGVCVPIVDFSSIEKDVKIINSLKEIKFVELRIDYLEDLKNLDKIINSIEKKVILTNRIEKEGGKFFGTITKNLSILKKYANKCEFVDFELCNGDYIFDLKKELKNTKLIISYHNFVETPSLEELKDILDRMKKFTPDVYKISVMPKTGEDVKKIYDLTFYFKRNFLEDFVFISMGKLGQETRIEIPKMGGLLSFGSFLNSSAPGQINYKRLYKLITKKS